MPQIHIGAAIGDGDQAQEKKPEQFLRVVNFHGAVMF